MNSTTSRIAVLMGTASLVTMIQALQAAQAQMTGQASSPQASEEAPESVLITGSLIHGGVAVGVPVTNLGLRDFTTTGFATIGELFRTVPAANVGPGPAAVSSAGNQEGATRVNIRALDATGPRSLLMVDGVRFPPQTDGICAIDPSIIPALAVDHVDILTDGASAIYGSDAIAGVINVILKRNFDGAITMLHVQAPDKGGLQFQASQLYGRTWDGGDVTLTYEWSDQQPVLGTAHSNYTANYSPWGLDDQTPIGSSMPGTISVGKPSTGNGTSCNNCFAIPHGAGANFPGGLGPTNPSSASTLDWTSFSANAANKHTNEIDPFKHAWEISAQQKNAFVATFDQRLTKDISFFASGFYADRRVEELVSPDHSQGLSRYLRTWSVPTTNPYYPINAPSNLRVSYSFATEMPPTIPAYELAYRYQFGLNFELPKDWHGQIYDSRSHDTNQYHVTLVNVNAINVALGNDVDGSPSKPGNVPYLNLFCDPTKFQCNSPATLAYIRADRYLGDHYTIEEKALHLDGPLFDLPAGQVKVAIGGNYESDNVVGYNGNNAPQPAATPLSIIYDSEPYSVWAGFAQVNIPVFGDNFNFPMFRKLDFEASWRHDQYQGTLSGGTSNPRMAFTWGLSEDLGATVRGSWGTSFRFANAGEYSTVLSDANTPLNLLNLNPAPLPCGAGNVPTPGTAAAALFAAGFACGSLPGGLDWGGGPHPALRSYINASTGLPTAREGGTSLAPETSINYSVGFELAPQAFLKGLDVSATWYSVKVNSTLTEFTTFSGGTLGDPQQRFHIIVPSDLGCPVAANANPASCAPFEKMVQAAILDPNTTLDLSSATSVYFLNDGSTFGEGFIHVEGIDWNVSYDFDTGDFGVWNVGAVGTYYMHRYSAVAPGGTVIDMFHQDIQTAGGIAQNGVETLPRFIYRARLGWSNGPFNVTGFMNYVSHYYSTLDVPPNVNFQCTTPHGNQGGGTFPCAIMGWTNIEPSWYTFDLSLGYDTGDMPANDYLKGITLQFTIQNIMGRHSPFQYAPSSGGSRNISAYDDQKPNTGRVIGFTVLKKW